MGDAGNTSRLSADHALALWREYRETDDQRIRDRLVMTFTPMVRHIVFKKIREVPPHCDVEDFMSCGLEALITVMDSYNPARGATLEQYAWTRVHGAVLDELRRQDWVPHSVRRSQRDIAGDEGTPVERIHTLRGEKDSSDPELAADAGELNERFRQAFRVLSIREREVAVLLYLKNLRLREVGEIIGVSESRVSQIHTQLKRTLREAFVDEGVRLSEVA